MKAYNEYSKKELLEELEDCNTSHLFHIIMSLATSGGWILIWLYCTFINRSDRNEIKTAILEK